MKRAFASILAVTVTAISIAAHAADVTPSVDAGAYLGHQIYLKAAGDKVSTSAAEAHARLSAIVSKDKAEVQNATSAEKRAQLRRAQAELAELNQKLGKSLLKQDAVIIVAITGTTVFATSIAGRVAFESTERLLGATEKVVPNWKGLGLVNRTLLSMTGVFDRIGRAATRITLVTGAVGSAATLYLFWCERQDVQRLSAEVAKSLTEVEQMIAAIDFVDGPK